MTCACSDYNGKADLYRNQTVPHLTQTAIYPDTGFAWEKQGEVEVKTLDQCLIEAGFPKLDAVSIDVDGIELKILVGLNVGKWRPKVIIVEENAAGGPIAELLSDYTRGPQMCHDHIYVLKEPTP